MFSTKGKHLKSETQIKLLFFHTFNSYFTKLNQKILTKKASFFEKIRHGKWETIYQKGQETYLSRHIELYREDTRIQTVLFWANMN
jgi:hypothetical protein